MSVIEYRQKHHRCRTCQHAKDCGIVFDFWMCLAKNTRHKGQLTETKLKGMLCSAYQAKDGDGNG
jgi:hypothetical protein